VFPDLPAVRAAIVNIGNETCYFTEGGDYRSGRRDRFRFEVRNERREVVPIREHRGMGGGLSARSELAPRKRWKVTLHPSSYLAPVPPGKHTVRILYHDRRTISNAKSVEGLILVASASWCLEVKPRIVERTAEQRTIADAAIAALAEKGPVKIARHVAWRDGYVDPASADGRLLALGWTAVPSLVDALEREGLGVGRRARILALLYSVTGLGDPRRGDILGSYEARIGRPPTSESGGILGPGRTTSTSDSPPPAEAQAPLVERWRAWRRHLEVRDRD
jgi:hypothetical protein